MAQRITRVSQTDERPERRQAMEIWGRFIVDCCDGKDPQTERPSNVVP
jgi:hypothetical protein